MEQRFTIKDLLERGEILTGWKRIAEALQEAERKMEEERGIIASLPYLIAGRSEADKHHFLNPYFFYSLDALSEELVVVDKKGQFTGKGERLVVNLHGPGILSSERIFRAYGEGLEFGAAKLHPRETKPLPEGRLPNGRSIELYHVDDVRRGKTSHDVFGNYAVVQDFEKAKITKNGMQSKREFMQNDLVLSRAGAMEYLDSYFEKCNKNKMIGNWHKLNQNYKVKEWGRLLFLNDDFDGLGGNSGLNGGGRFVWVAPEAPRQISGPKDGAGQGMNYRSNPLWQGKGEVVYPETPIRQEPQEPRESWYKRLIGLFR